MKKTIKIICGIFILCTITENINFMFAQFEDTETNPIDGIIDLNNENKSDSNPGEEIPEQVTNPDNNQTISVDNNEKNSNSEEITDQIEEDLNITPSPKLRGAPMMTVSQSTQTIDTSNYGIIRIKDPEHPGKGITIHDRNLGASTTGAGVDETRNSFGYYFQWGNNYGFPSNPSESIITDNAQVDASNYGPENPYSSDTFITGNPDWSSVRNDNLRGGSGDSRDGNGRGYPVENPTDRRGPCPENYHVPSIGEWSKLLEFWANGYTGLLVLSADSSNNLKYFENNITALNNFYTNFYIPIAGNLSYKDSYTEDIGIQSLLRSSSPKTSNNGIFRLFGTNPKLYSHDYTMSRANAFPIRCFYNSYRLPVKITYDLNGGYRADEENSENKVITYTKIDDDSEYEGDIALGTVRRANNCGENEDKKCMFGGWYTFTGNEMWTGNIIEDITLIAKWLEFDDRDISYSGVNFSVMDRNLGAEFSGTGEDTYGYYLTGGEDNILCPEGYHIPSTGEWIGIKNLLGSDFNGNFVKDLINLPFAGKMVKNEVVENEDSGYYLTKDGDEIKYAKINESDFEIKNLDDGEKVSVRCFKDYNTGTIKFNTNGGNKIDDIISVNWREEGENLPNSERDNSNFLGWYTTPGFQEGTKLEENINYKDKEEINLYAKRECEEGYQEGDNSCDAIYFNISWIDGDENVIKTDSVRWGEIPIYNGNTPTKSPTANYKYNFNGKWLPEIVAAYENTGYTAQFDTEIINKSGGYSGGGGGRNKSNSSDNFTGTHNSPENSQNNTIISSGTNIEVFGEKTQDSSINAQNNTNTRSTSDKFSERYNDSLQDLSNYSQEFIDAYNFAYKNGITSKTSIESAKMYSSITRIQMAKMLSNYAINVLGKEPDLSRGAIKFDDVSNKLNKDYGNAVTLAYQLGIMGQNIKSNRFRPYDEVTRAEFATALSRLLYGIKDGGNKYYFPHLAKLYNEGIMKKIDPHFKEKKGYVMIILLRTK